MPALNDRFVQGVRDSALVPPDVLEDCVEEAGRGLPGRTNVPLVEILIERHLLEASDVLGLLKSLGADRLVCPQCRRTIAVEQAFNRLRPTFSCEACHVPLDFVAKSGGVAAGPPSAARGELKAALPAMGKTPPLGAARPPTGGPGRAAPAGRPAGPGSGAGGWEGAATVRMGPGQGQRTPDFSDLPDLPELPDLSDEPVDIPDLGALAEDETDDADDEPEMEAPTLNVRWGDAAPAGTAADAPTRAALRPPVGRDTPSPRAPGSRDTPAPRPASRETPVPRAARSGDTGRPAAGAPSAGGAGTLAPGQTLDGRYQVHEAIRGLRGQVWKAVERGLDRTVAVKVIDRRTDTQDRLVRELDAIGKLSHPNIATILNVGQLGAGKEYLVIGYVEGPTLGEEARRRGKIEPREASRICRDLADALQHAHGRGIVHGRLGPDSIRLDASRTPLVVDLCLEPAAPPDLGGAQAPETRGGRAADARSDVFALGALYYLLLTGRAVTPGPVTDPTTINPRVPRAASQLCLRMLSRDPAKRPASMQELRKALSAAMESHTSMQSTHAHAPAADLKSRLIVLASTTVVCAALVAALYLFRDESSAPRGVLTPVSGLPTGPIGAGGGSAQTPSGQDRAGPLLAEAQQLLADKKWAAARVKLGEAVKAGAQLAGTRLERMPRELEAWEQASRPDLKGNALTRLLARSARDLPDSAPLLAIAEKSLLWGLKLTSEPTGARLTLNPIDLETGRIDSGADKAIDLGTTPVDFPFISEAAAFQLVVRFPGDRGRELKFPIEFRRDVIGSQSKPRIKALEVRLAGLVDGMCLVPAQSGAAKVQERGADRDFLIDENEVTNQQYLAFAREVNAGLPPLLAQNNGQIPPGAEQFPVFGLSYVQAQYFALWSGKRIPYKNEWLKAAGEQDNRNYPWGSQFSPDLAVTSDGGNRQPLKVGGRPRGASPYGVLDMSGNLAEVVLPPTTGPRIQLLTLGGSYADDKRGVMINGSRAQPIDNVDVGQVTIGLRCAKSLLVDREGREISLDRALTDENPGVVIEALYRLFTSGKPDDLERMFAKASATEEVVAQAARFYLMRSDESRLRVLLEAKIAATETTSRLQAARCLRTNLRPALVSMVTPLTRDADPLVRTQAYQAIASRSDPQWLAAYQLGLRDSIAEIRQLAQRAMSGLPRSPEALDAMRPLLADTDPTIKANAAVVLVSWRDASSLPAILEAMFRAEPNARQAIQTTIGVLEPAAVLAALAPHLESKDVVIRAQALALAGQMGGVEHRAAMRAALASNDENLVAGGTAGLVELGLPIDIPAVLVPILANRFNAQFTMQLLDRLSHTHHPAVARALLELLGRTGQPDNVRIGWVGLLGVVGGPDAANGLAALFERAPPDAFLSTQFATYYAMARSGLPRAGDIIRARMPITAMKTPQDQMFHYTLTAATGTQASVEWVVKQLAGQPRWENNQAATILGHGLLRVDEESLYKLLEAKHAVLAPAAAFGLTLRPRPIDFARLARVIPELPLDAQLQLLFIGRNNREPGAIALVRHVGQEPRMPPRIRTLALQTESMLLAESHRRAAVAALTPAERGDGAPGDGSGSGSGSGSAAGSGAGSGSGSAAGSGAGSGSGSAAGSGSK